VEGEKLRQTWPRAEHFSSGVTVLT